MIRIHLSLLRQISLRTSSRGKSPMRILPPQWSQKSISKLITLQIQPLLEAVVMPPHPFVLRFGFDSVENPSKKGFTFGDTPECQVQLLTKDAQRYFSIRYNFNSGALLIRAHMPIQVGAKPLRRSQSLVLMPDMEIMLRHQHIMFSVEFPDISHCVELHKENYRRYCMRCGLNNASYMQTITEDHELIAGHRCLSPIGRGGFGTVYEAINMSSGRKVALKHILGNASIMKEVEILRELRHVRKNPLI